ncbi:MAG: flagellar motor protein MotB [Burkholderiaceae bacterium]
MAASDKKIQPIIVKKARKPARGHAHGAWKIAYADFVTAMMAFFLLMWLLGSTTKGDLKGIADHFSTPLHVALNAGSGSGDSSSIINAGGTDLTRSMGQVKRGESEVRERAVNPHALARENRRIESRRLHALREKVESVVASDPTLADMRKHLRMDLTSDGLRIQIVDDRRRPMFDSGGAEVKYYMRDLLRAIGNVLNEVENRVSLAGHTDAALYAHGPGGYTNWELSSERANASRRELISGGMREEKIIRVEGLGSTQLFDPENPLNPMNRRISIVVMTSEASERILRGPQVEDEDDIYGDDAFQGAPRPADERLSMPGPVIEETAR